MTTGREHVDHLERCFSTKKTYAEKGKGRIKWSLKHSHVDKALEQESQRKDRKGGKKKVFREEGREADRSKPKLF